MSDVYNSSYTGTQIDSAVGSVLNKESTWDGKQNKLTGQQGQVVGFDSTGNAVAQDNPGGGLPAGGTPGQMLYQGESGAEWGDKPIFRVAVTISGQSVTCDKTPLEIAEAYNKGFEIQAMWPLDPESDYFYSGQLYYMDYTDSSAELILLVDMGNGTAYAFAGEQTVGGSPSWGVEVYSPSADNIRFSSTTGLTADNVRDAIEEVNEKIPAKPQSVTVTLTAAGWSSNTQTVTVQGVETSGQSVRISPATKTDADNWVAAGVWCSEPTTANQLVFTCDTAPTENININVELQEVQS